jgi:arylformamidase
MRIYDLTRTFTEGMPVYPGDPPVRFEPHTRYAADGYRVTQVSMGTHAGTHLDAPAHFLPDGITVDALVLEQLVGPARVVHIGDVTEVQPGERLLIRTGWGGRWGEPEFFKSFPGIPEELARMLAQAPAALLGLETPSLHPDQDVDARLHRELLKAGIVVVENLVGLDRLPERVWLAALPLPLAGLDGSPCRVVAWNLESEQLT